MDILIESTFKMQSSNNPESHDDSELNLSEYMAPLFFSCFIQHYNFCAGRTFAVYFRYGYVILWSNLKCLC
jgi:hypothetical protein